MLPISSEEGAFVRQFETADFAGDGDREGSFLVSEELALQQTSGIAAQLNLTNGRSRRELRLWTARAIQQQCRRGWG